MGDDQRRAAPGQKPQGLLDLLLGFGIERRSRLVENQYRRVLEQRPGDGDALALAAGKQAGVVAHFGVEAVLQAGDEFHGMGIAGGALDPPPVEAVFAVGDIFGDAALEQHHILADHRKLAAQVAELIIGERHAIKGDRARIAGIKTREQAGDRRFAAARAADEGDGLVRFRLEADVFQGFGIAIIGKADIAEFDSAFNAPAGEGAGVGLRWLVKHGEHARRRRESALDHRIDLGKLANRPRQQPGGGDEGNEFARCFVGEERRRERKPDERRHRHRHDELHQRRADAQGHGDLHVLAAVALAGVAQFAVDIGLGVEDAHDLVALHRFEDDLGNIAHRILHLLAVAAEAARRRPHHHPHQRGDNEKEQAEAPVDVEQIGEQPQHDQALAHDNSEGAAAGFGHLADVVAELGDELARLPAIEKARRQQYQALAQQRAQAVGHLAGDLGHRIAAEKAADTAHQGDGEAIEHGEAAQFRGVVRTDGVGQPAEPPGEPGGRQREQDEAEDR